MKSRLPSSLPDPGQHPLQAAWDALRYPLGTGAVATSLTLLLCHLVASIVPVLSVLLHFLCWLMLYKYALEVLGTTAEGGHTPPDGWSVVDPAVERDHHWLQLLALILLLALTRIAPETWQVGLLFGLSLLLPGMVLALAITQNLWAALNPLAWVRMGARLGPSYLLLAAMSWPVLWLQAHGDALVDGSGAPLLALPLFYLIAQHLTLSAFRLFGLSAHAHAEAFNIQRRDDTRPVLARERQQQHQSDAIAKAMQVIDPLERAAQLRPQLDQGAPEALHREYRRCLRESGDKTALDEHARRRVCELLNLDEPRLAVALANEALADAPDFSPHDAPHTDALATAAERMALLQQAASLLANYRATYPRRYDGIPLAMRAAQLYADRLQQPDTALRLLRAAQPMTAAGEQSAAFTRAIERLQQGLPIAEPPVPGTH